MKLSPEEKEQRKTLEKNLKTRKTAKRRSSKT